MFYLNTLKKDLKEYIFLLSQIGTWNLISTSCTFLFDLSVYALSNKIKQKQAKFSKTEMAIKDYVTKNNVTFIRSNSVNGGELVRPSILMIDVMDSECRILNGHLREFPSSGFSVYLLSIFGPINSMYWRISIDYSNFANQSNWTSFLIAFVMHRNKWRFWNVIRLAKIIIYICVCVCDILIDILLYTCAS